jgi:hypothetical protein
MSDQDKADKFLKRLVGGTKSNDEQYRPHVGDKPQGTPNTPGRPTAPPPAPGQAGPKPFIAKDET